LDRTQPGLPLSEGRIASRTHDYKRHGTTSLYAAFNILTGQVIGQVTQQHRSQEFLAFMKDIKRQAPKGKELHIILDNLSAHKTPAVMEWLEKNPRIQWVSAGPQIRSAFTGCMPSIGGRGDLQHPADRLDPKAFAVFINEGG